MVVASSPTTSNAAVSESPATLVRLSSVGCTSSQIHCSHDGRMVSSAPPTSPVFSTPLAAESVSAVSHSCSSSPAARHSLPMSVAPRQPALFSPPTDMDTDVSAIIGHAAEDSELWKSDVSFEVITIIIIIIL